LTDVVEPARFGRVALLGCGMIGGSLMAALRAAGAVERVIGYDRDAGYYRLRTQLPTLAMGFESFWANPNQYLQIRFRVRGDGRPRRIMIQHDSPFAGTLEAGVLADRYGFPLPVPVQACKNFNGEGEEPDDTAKREADEQDEAASSEPEPAAATAS